MQEKHIVEKSRGFSPGFRFSTLDGVVLLLGTAALTSILLLSVWNELFLFAVIGVSLPIAAFFLFCNVFRVRRSLELAWAALFVLLMASWLAWSFVSIRQVIAVAVAGIAAVVLIEMRTPSYHGVGWRWINPRLPEWWAEKHRSR